MHCEKYYLSGLQTLPFTPTLPPTVLEEGKEDLSPVERVKIVHAAWGKQARRRQDRYRHYRKRVAEDEIATRRHTLVLAHVTDGFTFRTEVPEIKQQQPEMKYQPSEVKSDQPASKVILDADTEQSEGVTWIHDARRTLRPRFVFTTRIGNIIEIKQDHPIVEPPLPPLWPRKRDPHNQRWRFTNVVRLRTRAKKRRPHPRDVQIAGENDQKQKLDNFTFGPLAEIAIPSTTSSREISKSSSSNSSVTLVDHKLSFAMPPPLEKKSETIETKSSPVPLPVLLIPGDNKSSPLPVLLLENKRSPPQERVETKLLPLVFLPEKKSSPLAVLQEKKQKPAAGAKPHLSTNKRAREEEAELEDGESRIALTKRPATETPLAEPFPTSIVAAAAMRGGGVHTQKIQRVASVQLFLWKHLQVGDFWSRPGEEEKTSTRLYDDYVGFCKRQKWRTASKVGFGKIWNGRFPFATKRGSVKGEKITSYQLPTLPIARASLGIPCSPIECPVRASESRAFC